LASKAGLSTVRSMPPPQPREAPATPARNRGESSAEASGPRVIASVASRSSRPTISGAIGYAIHGLACLTAAIIAVAQLGQVAWFVSALLGALALNSLYRCLLNLRRGQREVGR